MQKSFKKHVFIRLFFAVIFVILVNRITSKAMMPGVITDHVVHDMSHVLLNCENKISDVNDFFVCANKNHLEEFSLNMANSYLLCTEKNQKNNPIVEVNTNICSDFRGLQAESNEKKLLPDSMVLLKKTIDSQEWIAVTLNEKQDAAMLLVRESDIDKIVRNAWGWRDQIIIYSLPALLLSVLLLTIYLTRAVVSPLSRIEKKLRRLSSDNLGRPIDLTVPYKEFQSFVDVFDGMRNRLNEGFIQMRRFSADASHELRTPLTILRGNAEKLIADFPLGSESQIKMRLMSDEVERLIEITEKLLLLSRADARSIQADMREVSLSDMVNQLVADADLFRPSLKITSKIQPGVHWNCDESLIHQLIYNIYTNAIKYNIDSGWIHFNLEKTKEGFILAISNPADNPPVDLPEKAFQRFYRGDTAHARAIDGIGLGLSLSLEIAKIHQASLCMSVGEHNVVTTTLRYPANE
jgi:signal transduction histidine kinase